MYKLIAIVIFVLMAVPSYSAELLVYNGVHWSVKKDRGSEFPTRYRRGDVLHVRPNGFYRSPLNPQGKGWNRQVFKLIRVQLTALQTKRLHKPLYDNTDPENSIMLARRKFNIRRILRLANAQNRIGVLANTSELNLFEKTAGDIVPVLDPEV